MSQRQITIRDLWQIIWKRKFWLIVPLVIVTAVAFGGSYLLPTVYQSSTKVVISNQKFLSPTLERLLPNESGVLPEPRARQYWLAATRSEIMSSGYINRMIEQLKLEPSPDVVEAGLKMLAQFPDNDLATMVRTLQIEELRDNIEVDLIGENQVVITAQSENPRQATNMATALAEVYRERKLSEQVMAGDEGQSLAEKQLSLAKKEYEDAQQELADFTNSYRNRQLETGVNSDQNLLQIESEVDATRLEIDEAADRVKFLAAQVVNLGVDTAKVLRATPGIRRHKANALAATRQVAQLTARYLWKDGKIQFQLVRTRDALDSLQTESANIARDEYPQLPANARGDVSELIFRVHEIDFLRGKEKSLAGAMNDIKGIIAGQPYYDQKVKRLEGKVDEKRKEYTNWQDEAQRQKIGRASKEAEAETRYTILEPASIPLAPASPNRVKISLMGLALGLIMGGCAVVISEVVDHSIKRIEDIEELLGLEVVGTIPNIDATTQPRGVKAA